MVYLSKGDEYRMKLRKIICLILTAAVVMTAAAFVSVPAVFAATVSTGTEFGEDFSAYSLTSAVGAESTMTALFNAGWRPVAADTVYAMADPADEIYHFCEITDYGGSRCLKINTVKKNEDGNVKLYSDYGLGRAFPGQGSAKHTSGVWKIDFKLCPGKVGSNPIQFCMSMNTYDGSAPDSKTAQHNIISAYNNKVYMGYRDYNTLYKYNIEQGIIKGVNSIQKWYDISVKVDCDNRYYSVTVSNNGKLIARRSPISFDGQETLGFLKLSALGISKDSTVYIDNVHIKRAVRETLIYEESFTSSYTGSAAEGMTTGGSSEVYTGGCYFGADTPFRYNSSVGKAYSLETDNVLGSQVVRLGDNPATGAAEEASGLVYMPANEKLLTAATEKQRGMLKLSFKIKPETVTDDVTVNAIPGVSSDITNDKYAFFRITDNAGTPAAVNGEGAYMPLNAADWYNVDLIFDIVGRTVSTAVKDIAGNKIADFAVTGASVPYSVTAVMFMVDGGSSVLMDDIKLEYYMPAPSLDADKIIVTDRFGNETAGLSVVTTAAESIKIPLGCLIDENTANSSSIVLKDSENNTVSCEGFVSGTSYVLKPDTALGLNREYTLKLSGTLANIFGDKPGEDITLTFTAANELSDFMEISAVNIGGAPVRDLSDVTAGSDVDVVLSYENSSGTAKKGTLVLSFFGGDKLIGLKTVSKTVQSGESGACSAAFTVPSELDTDTVDEMKVFLWDGPVSISPISRRISYIKKDEARYRDYVDFTVNIESGREAVILQLTDTQIIDSYQRRADSTLGTVASEFWKPEYMEERLFGDLRNVIEEVDPDLILLTGDLVYGKYDDAGTSFKMLADFMDGYGIPWAPVFGNHDNESSMGADWQCEYFEGCENCLFKQRNLTGNGNYSIGIVQGGELKRVIFMLDSNGCGAMSDATLNNGHSKKTAGFGDDQIEWYTEAAEHINEDFENIKYTFAFHIQPAVFEDALHETYGFVNNGEVNERHDLISPLNIDERADKRDTDFGYIGRNLKGPWDTDRSVYSGMKLLGADSVLVGHEHCNSASVVYDGVRFQYGQKIGEYDRINFRKQDGTIFGAQAYAPLMDSNSAGTPILGGTVMKLSEETGEISDAYIHYCPK